MFANSCPGMIACCSFTNSLVLNDSVLSGNQSWIHSQSFPSLHRRRNRVQVKPLMRRWNSRNLYRSVLCKNLNINEYSRTIQDDALRSLQEESFSKFVQSNYIKKLHLPMEVIDDTSSKKSVTSDDDGDLTLHIFPQNLFSISAVNPNKAVFTVDAETAQILMVNNVAGYWLGYSANEFCQMSLYDLFHDTHKHFLSTLAEDQFIAKDGSTVLICGRVIDFISKSGTVIPLSLWLQKLEPENRCIVVAEPVKRIVAKLLITLEGVVSSVDEDALKLFEYEECELKGSDVCNIIPGIKLPSSETITKDIKKQMTTGRTKGGNMFSLCLQINKDGQHSLYEILIWVYHNLSGLLVLNEEGIIENCNHFHVSLLFGYPERSLIGKHVEILLPNFGHDTEYNNGKLQSSISCSENIHTWEEDSDRFDVDFKDWTNVSPIRNNCMKNHHVDIDMMPAINVETPSQDYALFVNKNDSERSVRDDSDFSNSKGGNISPVTPLCDPTDKIDAPCDNDISVHDENVENLELEDKVLSSKETNLDMPYNCKSNGDLHSLKESSTSTPYFHRSAQRRFMFDTEDDKRNPCVNGKYKNGKYIGLAKHKNGTCLETVYNILAFKSQEEKLVYLLWIYQNSDLEDEIAFEADLTLTSSISSARDSSSMQVCKQTDDKDRCLSGSSFSALHDQFIEGEYSEHYETLDEIGRGAFGYVRLAYRKEDSLLVITKFVHKSKVNADLWIKDNEDKDKRIPLELHILKKVQHPNVVKVIDIFENDMFYQLVMEKHGAGMDLFEYIERQKYIYEDLNIYIFKQIVSAVTYLHSLNVVHRDIKDENIVIDEKFHIKLIDFGSAAYMEEGKKFSSFFGTVEYCSPEVLAGNSYEGKELEVWSMGILLYVLTFREIPFMQAPDIINCPLQFPFQVSEDLVNLLKGMLKKNPSERYTVDDVHNDPWLNRSIDMTRFSFEKVVSCRSDELNYPVYYHDIVEGDGTGINFAQTRPVVTLSSPLGEPSDIIESSNSAESLTLENFTDDDENEDDDEEEEIKGKENDNDGVEEMNEDDNASIKDIE